MRRIGRRKRKARAMQRYLALSANVDKSIDHPYLLGYCQAETRFWESARHFINMKTLRQRGKEKHE